MVIFQMVSKQMPSHIRRIKNQRFLIEVLRGELSRQAIELEEEKRMRMELQEEINALKKERKKYKNQRKKKLKSLKHLLQIDMIHCMFLFLYTHIYKLVRKKNHTKNHLEFAQSKKSCNAL